VSVFALGLLVAGCGGPQEQQGSQEEGGSQEGVTEQATNEATEYAGTI
jgi:hypothetical protein